MRNAKSRVLELFPGDREKASRASAEVPPGVDAETPRPDAAVTDLDAAATGMVMLLRLTLDANEKQVNCTAIGPGNPLGVGRLTRSLIE
jgi:hypothetical protein